jgi:RNA polymerase sigma-70 factor (ECF subfamily)
MERLTPLECAAYVLREAFDYPYPRIAKIIDTSNAAARQLVRRARTHLSTERLAERHPVTS